MKHLKGNLSQEIRDPFPEHTGGVFYQHMKMGLYPVVDEIPQGFPNGTKSPNHCHGNRHGTRTPKEDLVPPGLLQDHEALGVLNTEDDPNLLFSMNQPILLT